MSGQLVQLLKSHSFLQKALQQHSVEMSDHDISALQKRIDRLFLDIVRFQSDVPQVTVAQARFLLTALSEVAVERDTTQVETVKALAAACRENLDRLERQLTALCGVVEAPARDPHSYLDSLADRVSILDANYRYLFCNRANASFHKKAPGHFVGRCNSDVVGAGYFAAISKPYYDQCLAGHSLTLLVRDPNHPTGVYSVRCNPIRDVAGGDVTSIMVMMCDVSHLPVPTEMIVPLPHSFPRSC
jgi:hypothetical protein